MLIKLLLIYTYTTPQKPKIVHDEDILIKIGFFVIHASESSGL